MAADGLTRIGHRLRTREGALLFFCEVRARDAQGTPLLLIHGGGAGSVATFDVDVPGYSLAADLAATHRPIILVDIRGWETSRMPPGLPTNGALAVRSDEAVRDIAALVDWALTRTRGARVALFGFASGGHWAGLYAARYPDRVERLAVLNTMYAVKAPWSLRAAFADPADPTRFNPAVPAFRSVDRDILIVNLRRWEERSGLRVDPRVVADHQRIAFSYGNIGADGTLRIPNGFSKDHFDLADGVGGWDAARVKAPILVVRSDIDHWSRLEDVEAIRRAAPDRTQVVSIAGAGHFVMFNPADNGRGQFVSALIQFFGRGRST